jgi:hypothetical protein
MERTIVQERNGQRVVVMDSISSVQPQDRGQVVVSASNGGKASGAVARALACALVICNDAGLGKDDAGIAGIRDLEEAGIPGAAVGHTSAEISNGLDTWEHGVLSYVNQAARRSGLEVGMDVKTAVTTYLEEAWPSHAS